MTQLDARAHKSRKALLNASISLLVSNPSASLTEVAAHAGVWVVQPFIDTLKPVNN